MRVRAMRGDLHPLAPVRRGARRGQHGTARHGTARHGTAQPSTARHSPARPGGSGWRGAGGAGRARGGPGAALPPRPCGTERGWSGAGAGLERGWSGAGAGLEPRRAARRKSGAAAGRRCRAAACARAGASRAGASRAGASRRRQPSAFRGRWTLRVRGVVLCPAPQTVRFLVPWRSAVARRFPQPGAARCRCPVGTRRVREALCAREQLPPCLARAAAPREHPQRFACPVLKPRAFGFHKRLTEGLFSARSPFGFGRDHQPHPLHSAPISISSSCFSEG
ncbi:serine-rich and transmembrane domain-containing protein 1 isoform X1 [Oenanthe melanoleuca]|uniref:serine-rich and transmembrane domain-containing protein 1 isoform X1 n=1 Tax=Oenanthe melanoleuca TaxID=2939378 RepID=UPI0024C13C5E|nr:serine-rich and transmembrane domain-containing protein 1 isoform X1 [Oenanthe melanoleuca]